MTAIIQGWGRSVPEDLRDKIVSTWGARAIYTGQIIDLLPDRQSWYMPGANTKGHPTDHERVVMNRLAKWVNTKGLTFLRKEAKRLFPEENRVVSLDDGLFHIEASPQSSHGYLYIRAWELKTD